MKKIILAISGVTLLLLALGAWQINRWTDTPHGRLTAPAAVLLKLVDLAADQKTDLDPLATRAARRKSISLVTGSPTPVFKVDDMRIPGPAQPIPVRIYQPTDMPAAKPVIVYFHGGGWVVGDLDSHDNLCRSLAVKTNAIVVAVDYRLAPEHRFPAAVDDAYAAVLWVAANSRILGADPAKMVVAGDSAGGNLAAVVAQLSRDLGGPRLRAQVLLYPAVDLSRLDRQSTTDFASGLFLTRERMRWFIDLYVPDKAARFSPKVSPLLAASYQGVAPAIVVTAKFDPLRDEGEEYADALRNAGVPVHLRRFEGMIHGFMSMDRWFPEAGEATNWVSEQLIDLLK
ncbi:MAG: alpha/beta hydrolase [Rhodocyclaceae bacterium]|nr:alpha/beta hydrolase [Rhodocyclaceae bacterium]